MEKRGKDRMTAFKVGFVKKLAHLGLPPDQLFGMMKSAVTDPTDLIAELMRGSAGTAKDIAGAGLSTAGTLGRYGLYGSVLAPLALGAAGGAADAYMGAPSSSDIENIRQQELVDSYKRLTREVQARRERRKAMQ